MNFLLRRSEARCGRERPARALPALAGEGARPTPRSIGPKRSESITATGRAPMVKMSRRIPPTPVAAP